MIVLCKLIIRLFLYFCNFQLRTLVTTISILGRVNKTRLRGERRLGDVSGVRGSGSGYSCRSAQIAKVRGSDLPAGVETRTQLRLQTVQYC